MYAITVLVKSTLQVITLTESLIPNTHTYCTWCVLVNYENSEADPIHSPEELELLPCAGMSKEPVYPIADAVLHLQTQLSDLWVDTHITEESELDWLVLARDCLGWGLDARPSQPARKLLDSERERERERCLMCAILVSLGHNQALFL